MRRKADAWQQGVDWFRNANVYYKEIISAKSLVIDRRECWCRERGDDYIGMWEYQGLYNPTNAPCDLGRGYECEVRDFYREAAEEESDGIVLEKSAKDFPGVIPLLLTGNSHLQMRNSPEIKNIFSQILNGEHGLFFQTDER
ncbi:MAG: hypothetical protein AAFO82_19170 [Bacteroidota bacterium]